MREALSQSAPDRGKTRATQGLAPFDSFGSAGLLRARLVLQLVNTTKFGSARLHPGALNNFSSSGFFFFVSSVASP